MEEFDYILYDKSNNDEELVKELSIYVKNHRDKKLPINKTFIIDIMSIILRNSEINFDDVYFKYNGVAGWHGSSGSFLFNITEILNVSKYLNKSSLKFKMDKSIVEYFYTLSTIIHELTHARQDYIMNDNRNEIYKSSYDLIRENYSVYKENHDEVLIERYANLRDTFAYQVLSYIYPQKYIGSLRKSIFYYLINGYKIDNGGEVKKLVNKL